MNRNLVFIFVIIGILISTCYSVKIKIQDHNKIDASNAYQIGVGSYDITGPAAETGMMGYAMPGQVTGGIHFRLRARAFVFIDSQGNRAAYVSTDSCMIFQAVKIKVVQDLQAIYGEEMYTEANVLLSGTHTHSGPGGYSMYALYGITTLGFYKDNFDTIVNGIVSAIQRAHDNVKPGRIMAEQSELWDTNVNRSPPAYANNPPEEQALYDANVDKNITVLKMEDMQGNPIAALTFFAVHCTSMNNSNHLISGDNKGYASYMWEKKVNGQNVLPGQGSFIAAFGQSNEGDVSPNTLGAFCPNGSRCSIDSTCDGKTEGCIAKGPGADMFESTQIIGNNQFQKAYAMWQNASIPVQGPIIYRHQWLQMTNVTVQPQFHPLNKTGTTCRAAMGYSFAAGTTDGPGAFDFTQGDNNTNGNPFWNLISKFIAVPTEEQKECQSPKPILIDVGMTKPYPWTPDVVPIQIITIGQIVLIAVPGEFTTMSGRRMRNTIRQVLQDGGMEDPIVLIAGLANTYTGYIATYEEYEVQRYEGASTIFGPLTLSAYQQEFAGLAQSIVEGTTLPPGPTPRNLTGHTWFLLPPVIFDEAPDGDFGRVYTDAQSSYTYGDSVNVVFYGANPRNNFMIESSFHTVDLQTSEGNWTTVYNDGDWDTRFYWKMHDLAQSLCTIQWNIANTTIPGTYRITHSGYAKPSSFSSKLVAYTGISSTFTVTAN
ncbi:neutral/alkaline nonlysosomal ceramidase family protein [Tieghemostelium lacteum]|uniref:Neutral ceramidase n=1 Tax=Tieghemostelium lacteum TaxID=361077 RepID=A0A152A6V0_TIELA|nr:neutral/alkaline nonlysosomal ceramidase family protein [Tieghemostelium lacteum]|eukprot:KYR01855.1 neutral/alkaline nonlysosomal ceramidase family protein [Tieghemostelium lacteum]